MGAGGSRPGPPPQASCPRSSAQGTGPSRGEVLHLLRREWDGDGGCCSKAQTLPPVPWSHSPPATLAHMPHPRYLKFSSQHGHEPHHVRNCPVATPGSQAAMPTGPRACPGTLRVGQGYRRSPPIPHGTRPSPASTSAAHTRLRVEQWAFSFRELLGAPWGQGPLLPGLFLGKEFSSEKPPHAACSRP